MSSEVLPADKQLPPGSLGLPFIGERPRLFDLEYMLEQYHQHGPIIKTRILGRNIAVLMGPEANRFLLSTHMEHFAWKDGWPPMFVELLGESLFVQDGDVAKKMRRLIMPALHRKALHNYLRTMEDFVLEYLARWEKLEAFRWLDENKELTFAIATKLLMGSEAGEKNTHLSRLFTQMTNGFITVPVRWSWTPFGKAIAARNQLLSHIEQAIEHRRANPTQDALSLLLATRDEDGNALTSKELQAQALLLLFAGHETTASMLTSFVLSLAENPAVWEKAHAEQVAIGIGDRLEMEHFSQMPYLEQVLKEVERMYPPVPAGFRGVVKPFEFNGYYVPAGWTALYWINVTHRDKSIYNDPHQFDPERFSPERNESASSYSLVGFGGGARTCVGYAFAQFEMKIVASYLLRFYDWELLPNQNLNMAYRPTISPKDGLKVRFWKRG